MRSLIFFFMIILSGTFIGCGSAKHLTDDEQLIIWDKAEPLVWTDYRGHRPEEDLQVDWKAVTISFIAYRTVSKNKAVVGAYFDRGQSWSMQQRVDLLKHEQYHFNITEIFARQMRKLIIEEHLIPGDETFKNLYASLIIEFNAMQHEYDKATGHGKNIEQQSLQEKLIDEKITALDAFKNPLVMY